MASLQHGHNRGTVGTRVDYLPFWVCVEWLVFLATILTFTCSLKMYRAVLHYNTIYFKILVCVCERDILTHGLTQPKSIFLPFTMKNVLWHHHTLLMTINGRGRKIRNKVGRRETRWLIIPRPPIGRMLRHWVIFQARGQRKGVSIFFFSSSS